MAHFPLEEFNSRTTPFYFYDMELLKKTIDVICAETSADDAFKVHYAVKANGNDVILKYIADRGLGADCVSGGEIRCAMNAGIPAGKIVYAGVGKTDSEILLALDCGIGCFNVESLAELEVLNALAGERGTVAKVALRVNPEIDAHTHHYITTGLEENKFGINLGQLDQVISSSLNMQNVELTGLHFHIGSQILTNEPFKLLCERINTLQEDLEGKGVSLKSINVGGGLGIDYDNPDAEPIPDFKAYFDVFRANLKLRAGQTVHFELGRSIVAQCGSLITRVLYVKEGTAKKFAIVDAGMTELIRPALYGAHHCIQNITLRETSASVYDVVGPVCESSDCFGQDVELPQLKRGDFLAIRSAGAYGEAMASNYNCRTLQAPVFGYK